MSTIIESIRRELRRAGDPKLIESYSNFFKESVKFYVVKNPAAIKVGKAHFKPIKNSGKAAIFALCEELWQSGYMEEALIACDWSYAVHKQYQPDDFKIFKKWVETYVTNWATCDTLCNHTVGTLIEMYPSFLAELKRWTKSKNRWMRRASAVSLIVPAKHGKFLKDVFEIAGALLLDSDDLVQKGYGWMLKESSRLHQKEVFNYVVKHKRTMPRTALRYAIEKMPENLRKLAMAK
jgi:3-methyladenine DNA glycosylase AlkD